MQEKKTSEEVLRDMPGCCNLTLEQKANILQAMTAYAEQVAKERAEGFEKWAFENKYKRLGTIGGVSQWAIPNSMDECTNPQLYDKYLNYLKEQDGQ